MEGKVIAFLDLDHTLLQGANGNLVIKYMIKRRRMGLDAIWKAIKFTVLYRLNKLPREEVYRWTFRECGKYDMDELLLMLDEAYEEYIMPRLFEEGMKCVQGHRSKGHITVIATAAGEYVSEKVRVQLGADDKIAAVAEVVDNRLTDELHMPVPYSEGKLALAEEYASGRSAALDDCFFYSDSIADLPLLKAVGNPVVVNPQRKLKKIADKRGWPVEYWNTPAGFSTPSQPEKLTF
ncbi:MAG: HAD-IB family hydrolase [Actinomycetota bacterium]|nr:HAD-IB family hydrolase [Actinomycetota bacterium]